MSSSSLKASNTLRERKFIISSGHTWTSTYLSSTISYTFPVNVKSFKVLSFNIPFAWYPINSRNNAIVFSESAGGGNVTATLTAGHYTVSQLLTELETRLNAASANTLTYTASVNTNTNLITITVSSGNTTFVWTSSPLTNAADLLGFTYADTVMVGSTVTASFPNKIERGTESNILIAVGTTGNTVSHGGGIYHDAVSTTFGIIAEVPVTAGYGSWLNPPEGFLGEEFPIIASQGRFFSSANATIFTLRFPRKIITPTGGSQVSEDDPALIVMNQKPWMLAISGTLGS